MGCPIDLKRLYRAGRVLPFIGAGASMAVNWQDTSGQDRRGPSWREMVDQAARMLGITVPDLLRTRGTDLQILEYFKAKKGGTAELTNWLHYNMQAPDLALQNSKIHTALGQLDKCSKFYTTNYDDFIERSLKLAGKNIQVVAHERHMGQSFGKVEVVKFHGDFTTPDRMVLSEGDYETRIQLRSDLDLKLRSDILGNAILFIGYSFRDVNVSYIFRLANDDFGKLPHSNGRRAYIIVFSPSDFELELFNRRGIEVIPAYGADKAEEVAKILDDMRS